MPLSLTRRSLGLASLAALPLPTLAAGTRTVTARLTHEGQITHEAIHLGHATLTRLALSSTMTRDMPDTTPHSAIVTPLRILCGDRTALWLYDDQRDQISMGQLQGNRLTQPSKSFWLGGHRLQSAGLTADGMALIGWDNRHSLLIALDTTNGRILARTPVTADAVTFSQRVTPVA